MTQNCQNGPKMTQNGPKISTKKIAQIYQPHLPLFASLLLVVLACSSFLVNLFCFLLTILDEYFNAHFSHILYMGWVHFHFLCPCSAICKVFFLQTGGSSSGDNLLAALTLSPLWHETPTDPAIHPTTRGRSVSSFSRERQV